MRGYLRGTGWTSGRTPSLPYETLLSIPGVQPQSIIRNKRKTKNGIIMKLIFSHLSFFQKNELLHLSYALSL